MSALKKTIVVKLTSLVLRGDHKRGLDQEVIAGIADSLERGEETPPVGMDRSKRLLWGRHRYEAHKKAGRKSIRADVFAFETPEAERAAVIAENLRRKHLTRDERDELIAEYLVLVGVKAPATAPSGLGHLSQSETRHAPAAKENRERKAKIKEAAKIGGVSTKTVERIAKREAAKDEGPAAPEHSEPPPPCIRAFGLEVPPAVDHRARQVQAAIDEIDKHLRAIAKIANGLEETGLSGHDAQKLSKDEYERFAFAARGCRPEALCPWCKGMAWGRGPSPCNGCHGTGFATVAKMRANVPEELLREGEAAMVAERGRMRKLREPSRSPKKGLGGRQLTIEDETGKPIEIEWEPTTGEVVLIEWDPGTAKRARFVRFTGPENILVEVERVDPKGAPTGEWGSPRSFSRKNLLGQAPPEEAF